MFKLLEKFRSTISKSIIDSMGRVSSSIISSYFILAYILFNATVYLVIDVVNAYQMWEAGKIYVLPYEHIVMFSLMLTHHLILLGIKSSKEKSILPSIIGNKAYEEVAAPVKPASEKKEEKDASDDLLLSGEMPS